MKAGGRRLNAARPKPAAKSWHWQLSSVPSTLPPGPSYQERRPEAGGILPRGIK